MAKLQSGTIIYGTGTVNTQLFVSGANATISTTTGALQVVGGIGVGAGGYFGGIVTATNFYVGGVWAVNTGSSIGYTGSQGTTGAQGTLGTTGAQGTTGFVGSRGYSGSLGYNGSQGTTGGTGSQGTTGPTTYPASGQVAVSSGSAWTTSAGGQMFSLGVGIAAGATQGSILATNNITAYATSDKKFKENIQDIPDALTKVSAIGGKTFDWTDEYIESQGGLDSYFRRKTDFGVIAQDVEEVFPVAIRVKNDGTLAVDYEKLCVLSFAAIKELKAELDQLKLIVQNLTK